VSEAWEEKKKRIEELCKRNLFECFEDKAYLLYILDKQGLTQKQLIKYLPKIRKVAHDEHIRLFNYKEERFIIHDLSYLKLSNFIEGEGDTYHLTKKGLRVLSEMEENLTERKKRPINKILDRFCPECQELSLKEGEKNKDLVYQKCSQCDFNVYYYKEGGEGGE
jgi:hypothetical protein